MTVGEVYKEAVNSEFTSLIVLIELIVLEKEMVNWEDDESAISYFLQDRFEKKLNEQMAKFGKQWGYYS